MLGEVKNERIDDLLLNFPDLSGIARRGEMRHGLRHSADEVVFAEEVDQIAVERFG